MSNPNQVPYATPGFTGEIGGIAAGSQVELVHLTTIMDSRGDPVESTHAIVDRGTPGMPRWVGVHTSYPDQRTLFTEVVEDTGNPAARPGDKFYFKNQR